MNRRELLKASAIAMAATALEGCGSVVPPQNGTLPTTQPVANQAVADLQIALNDAVFIDGLIGVAITFGCPFEPAYCPAAMAAQAAVVAGLDAAQQAIDNGSTLATIEALVAAAVRLVSALKVHPAVTAMATAAAVSPAVVEKTPVPATLKKKAQPKG